jgi:hypothetical protein
VLAAPAGYKIGPLFADNPELAESLFFGFKIHGETVGTSLS